jgi:putative hydrolase of the HAD superfamily
MMVSDIKAVFFDLDGTLFDRERAQLLVLDIIVHELDDVFAGIGRANLVDAFRESDRVATRELYKDNPAVENVRVRRGQVFLDLLGLNQVHADAIAEIYIEAYPCVHAPIDGALEVVEALATLFQLGVISNGLPDVQYRKLEKLGLRFDHVVLSEALGIRKPDPRIFWHAAGLLDREPEECLHVGDTYAADVVGAKRAGLVACWFNPGGLHPPQLDVECDFEVRTLTGVCEILDEVDDNDI